MGSLEEEIRGRLQIENLHDVEIESKKRVLPAQVKDLKKFLPKCKKTHHEKTSFFFDQFLDTPRLDLLRLGCSMRLRYKRNGAKIYLQYKGPGYIEQGLLFRSEFSTERLRGLTLEESHHDVIHFRETSIQRILRRSVKGEMARALRQHLGGSVLRRIGSAPIIAYYQKEKYVVDLGQAYLEPSVDRISAFHLNRSGPHSLSTFYEYENEVKANHSSFRFKLERIPELLEFDEKLCKKFDLKAEKLDKYHRLMSIFLPGARRQFQI